MIARVDFFYRNNELHLQNSPVNSREMEDALRSFKDSVYNVVNSKVFSSQQVHLFIEKSQINTQKFSPLVIMVLALVIPILRDSPNIPYSELLFSQATLISI